MDEERKIRSSSHLSVGIKSDPTNMGDKMDEEVPELKKTGADFYLKMLEKMQAADDPLLGQSFQGAAEEDQPADISTMALDQKLKSKNAKVKLAGIEELNGKFSETSEQTIKEELYGGILEGLSSPVPSLQKGTLDLILKILSSKNSGGWLDYKELIKQLVEKVLIAPKPLTKKPVQDMLVILFKRLGKDAFWDSIRENFTTKVAKIRAGMLKMFSDLLGFFGLKEFPALKYWEAFIKDAENTNPVVKKEFIQFSVELFRWFGDSFSVKLGTLKKSVADEITKLVEEKKNAQEGKQLLPSLEEYQAFYLKKVDESSTTGGKTLTDDQDAYDLFDSVDVYKNYGDKWVDKILAQEKWTDKKSLIDDFIIYAQSNPKHTGQYSHLIQLAKRLLEDSNMAVQIGAIKLLSVMSKGLRKEMMKDGKRVINLLLPKLKERKKLTDEIVDCLKNTVYFTSPQDNVEDYESLLKQKNNLLKLNVLEWLTWFASREEKNKIQSFISAFKNTMTRLVEDGAVEVRDANLMLIKTLCEKIGKENCGDLAKIVDKLPKTQAEKLCSIGDNSTRASDTSMDYKLGCSPRVSNRSTTVALATKKMDSESAVNTQSQFSKPVNKSNASLGTAGLDKFGSGFADVRLDLNLEWALSTLSCKGVTTEEWSGVEKLPWKAKLEFLQRIGNVVGESGTELELDALAILLTVSMKNFKESNPNLIKEYLNIIANLFSTVQERVSGKFVYSFAWFLEEKYGDSKFMEKQRTIIDGLNSKNIQRLILSLCEVISSKNPSPKVHGQLLSLIAELVAREPKLAPRKELTACAKESCANSNVGVRDEACNLFCVLYKYFGDVMKKTLTELNPQVKKSLEGKLEKILPILPESDENQPKKDISQQLVKMFPQFCDAKWTVRKDTLMEAAKMIKSAGKITAKGLSDFGNQLKLRLLDSNQLVSREALNLLRAYIKALGVEFKGQSRMLMPLIVPFLNDKQDTTRDAARETLDICQIAIGSDWILTHLITCLIDANSDLVLKIIDYLGQNDNPIKMKRADVRLYCKNTVQNLIHKNSSIRIATERLLEKTCYLSSREGWFEPVRDLSPTIRVLVEGILNKLLPQDQRDKEISDSARGNTSRRMDEELIEDKLLEKPTRKVKIGDFDIQDASSPSNKDYEDLKISKRLDSVTEVAEPEVYITYYEPKDSEIAAVKERLILSFGEAITEKMMSNEQSKIMDSLSNLGFIRLTNFDRYRRMLGLTFSWIYLRAFDTTRKPVLDLFSEFMLNNLDDFIARGITLEPSVYHKLIHVFIKILDHHPIKEECLGLIKKLTTSIAKSSFKEEIFTLLLEFLGKKDMDHQLISLILTEMIGSVDIRRCVSLKTINILEMFTNGLKDLTQHEIYHFYTRALQILGNKFLNVFSFVDKSILQRFFDLRTPANEVPSSTAIGVILRQFQSGDRDEKIRAIDALTRGIEDSSEPTLNEIAATTSLMALAVAKLPEPLFINIQDKEYCEALSRLLQRLFSLTKFTHSLGLASLFELLNSLLDSLVNSFMKSQSADRSEADNVKKFIAVLNHSIVQLITITPGRVSYLVLVDLMAAHLRLAMDPPEGWKQKGVVSVNCFLSLTKKIVNPVDLDNLNLSAILAKLDDFLSEFGEWTEGGEKSGAHKAINTFLNKICEVLGERIWDHYPAGKKQAQGVVAGGHKPLLNMIKVILLKDDHTVGGGRSREGSAPRNKGIAGQENTESI